MKPFIPSCRRCCLCRNQSEHFLNGTFPALTSRDASAFGRVSGFFVLVWRPPRRLGGGARQRYLRRRGGGGSSALPEPARRRDGRDESRRSAVASPEHVLRY